ncbi:glycosyltransferase family 4 protein [Gillisia sp. M10.2A]|uniref:Glycosyltransferase family 4 protein n=1 Tax=Gillisia lutea TaxID=2909668 RepID=A0ABS9EIK1_9FLAO|nr:glycosyltransferase family 4 protein [Gillisia lutea]MCF4102677.1 glycosyltransferase family 4 protein [Gillisia lutea]
MKILYYSTSFYANHGGSIQSIEFYSQLDKMNAVTKKFIHPKHPSSKKYKTDRKYSFRDILRRIPLLQVLFFYRRNKFNYNSLVNRIKDVDPDVVIIQIDSNFLQVKRLKKQFPELKIVNQINGSPFDEPFKNIAFKNYFLKEQIKSYQTADVNIFISDFSRGRIMKGAINTKRDIVVHNGTDPSKFYPIKNKTELREKWNYPHDAFILGYIGTLDFHKQLEILIDAFNEICSNYPTLFLVIIGDGPAMSKISYHINELGISNRVSLRGWVNHEYVNSHLNCFDIAVHHFANTYMNPLKIFEYLSAGLPVIAPDIPSIRETFQDRKDLLITGESKEELKVALLELINNNGFRELLSENQHLIHALEGNYTWERYTQKVIDAIKNTE